MICMDLFHYLSLLGNVDMLPSNLLFLDFFRDFRSMTNYYSFYKVFTWKIRCYSFVVSRLSLKSSGEDDLKIEIK